MPTRVLLCLSLLIPLRAPAQETAPQSGPVEGVAFRVYAGDGGDARLEAVLESLDAADVLLVGESHDDLVGHALERILLAGTVDRFDVRAGEVGRFRPVVLSLEMFERDVQYVVDEYVAGLITEDHFLRSARPWDHYESRYRAIVEEARTDSIPIVASNAPRRYVNRVTRLGPESLAELPATARLFLPPLPYPPASDVYRAEFEAVMAEAAEAIREQADTVPAGEAPADSGAPDHSTENALASQALWDAAMGYSIANALADRPGTLVLHLAGSFHVQNRTGIAERIAEYRPAARVVTVVLEPVEDIDAWSREDHAGLADFVVLTRRPEPHGGV